MRKTWLYLSLTALWASLAGFALLGGAAVVPDLVRYPMLGYGALGLAVFNLTRWYVAYRQERHRAAMEAVYRMNVGPDATKDLPILHPEFAFPPDERTPMP